MSGIALVLVVSKDFVEGLCRSRKWSVFCLCCSLPSAIGAGMLPSPLRLARDLSTLTVVFGDTNIWR